MSCTKTYLEMVQLETFEERFRYLVLHSAVGYETFGYDRYLNQTLYQSSEWKRVRNKVILRDNGCDLGHPDHPISGKVLIHHINPITQEQILNRDPAIFDLNNLICVSLATHNAIHYGSETQVPQTSFVVRAQGDTKLW